MDALNDSTMQYIGLLCAGGSLGFTALLVSMWLIWLTGTIAEAVREVTE